MTIGFITSGEPQAWLEVGISGLKADHAMQLPYPEIAYSTLL